MHTNPVAVESLQRIFREGFSAADIAESLISFDDSTSVNEVRSFMAEREFEFVGIRRRGLVAGLVERADLGEVGAAADFMRDIETSQVIQSSAPFSDVVLRLNDFPRLFVTAFGEISGLVTRSDLLKPPLRMWLFGMITLIEMRFSLLIERFCGGEQWREFVSEGRLQKAEALLEERQRRNQSLDLLDCLQFSDKGQIVARNKELRAQTRFESRRQIEDAFKGLERLRNNLAHSQDILCDWKIIVQLTENLERVLSGPPGLQPK
jgi:CBS domain